MKVSIFILLTVIPLTLKGQNLIPNPGFDLLSQCPNDHGQISLAFPWVVATNGTPDLYNECSAPNANQVPYAGHSIDSYQVQRSGGGYAGIFVYSNAANTAYEYIETPLLSPLIKSKTYYIEFYVSPDMTPISYRHYTDAIGLAFSDTFLYKNIPPPDPLLLIPAIENRGNIIKDTMGWTRISGCYTALGNENYAIIGNFRDYTETVLETENPNIWPITNYLYVEDVMVTKFDPLPDSILLCNDEPIILNAGFLDAAYLWNTGESDSNIIIKDAGYYMVEAFLNNCTLRDTVKAIKINELQYFPVDTTICQDESLILSSPMEGEYLWSNGSLESSITVNLAGYYEVTITNVCGEFIMGTNVNQELCECDIYVPNVISANNDGINDYLHVNIACDFEYFINKFSLFDRWGNNVYTSVQSEEINWDGKLNGKSIQAGVYVWFLDYGVRRNGVTEILSKRGDLTIMK